MSVYRPREDSYLLRDRVESLDLEGKKLLDMGTGTGIVGISAAKQGAEVTAADINSEALEMAKEKAGQEGVRDNITFVESDLFENVNGCFDLIVFNPPYLAGERKGEEDALVGGEAGTEIIESFLSDAEEYLEPDGRILFVASSHSELDQLKEEYDVELVKAENLWFEKLFLFKLGNSFL